MLSKSVFRRFPPIKCLEKFGLATKAKKKSNWESAVGLEIHAQINTESKLFSSASTSFASPVNANVAFFDAAIPGTLPTLNKNCVELGVLTALALSCEVNETSFFDRKHYFYADLPSGYQITQQRRPIAVDGNVHFHIFTPGVHKCAYEKTSKIKQIQLEQDSGKSLHDEDSNRSLIDLNRAGVPLMELVFEPDLKDGEEAAALVKELILILRRINTCSCKMEEGALRVDANVSVNKLGESLGTRTEIKNISSVRAVAKAIDYEIERQISILEDGNRIVNETRSWDAIGSKTVPMRDKEVKQDYRFMPEPNLPPLRLNLKNEEIKGEVNVLKLKKSLPELPEETRNKLKEKYGLSREMITHLVNEDILLELFFSIKSDSLRDAKLIAKVITIELLSFVNKEILSLQEKSKLHSLGLGDVIDLLQSGDINLNTARMIIEDKINGNPDNPKTIVKKNDWFQINDDTILKTICAHAMEKNPDAVKKYKKGKLKVFPAFLGYVVKETNNRANMAKVASILKEMLESK